MLEGTGAGKVGGCDDPMVKGVEEVDGCDGEEEGVLCDSDMVTDDYSRKNKHEQNWNLLPAQSFNVLLSGVHFICST